jgi:hypothetical protein
MKNFFSLHLDLFGFFASILCAVHCATIPILLTVSTWSGLQLLSNPSIEIMVLCASTALALVSIVPAYIKFHRRPDAIVLISIGFILIGLSRLNVMEVWEIFLTSAGAALVASAHILNWRLCKNCTSNPSKKIV